MFCALVSPNYWWKAEVPGEDFLCPWIEEEDGEEDKEQEGWNCGGLFIRLSGGLLCLPWYSVTAAIASCWANRTPENQYWTFRIKLSVWFGVSIQPTENPSSANIKTTGLVAPDTQRYCSKQSNEVRNMVLVSDLFLIFKKTVCPSSWGLIVLRIHCCISQHLHLYWSDVWLIAKLNGNKS